MKTNSRLAAMILAISMIIGMSIPAFASPFSNEYEFTSSSTTTQEATITATVDATTFDVTVPTILPVEIGSDGSATIADEGTYAIVNSSAGAIEITDIQVTAATGWTHVKADDLKSAAIDSKKFAFYINGNDTKVANTATLISSFSNTFIKAGGNLAFDYNVKVSPSSKDLGSATSKVTVATVVFTLGWYGANDG
jgi:hypothetical protein